VSDDNGASERKNWMADGFKMRFKADLVPVLLTWTRSHPCSSRFARLPISSRRLRARETARDCLQVSKLYCMAPPEPVSAFITKLESSIAVVQARKRRPNERVKGANGAQ
jgi:hypothetical protein